ncbi:MAG: putative capsid protein [Genomoviridae sp.]|uniref:putative capsid protein n=1 Tax=Genomoviridae sp. TaxID=2202565 RepID=UPI002481BCC6|nr:MAG: putative capsid protein [Genomoviridae sp.]QCW23734.1 MAG: putative capsid protein [Genomoviridae sp.]
MPQSRIRRRRYRRRVFRRRPIRSRRRPRIRRTRQSRRRLLNIVSTKKKDTMLPYYAFSGAFTKGPIVFDGSSNTTKLVLWNASARPLKVAIGTEATTYRGATEVFQRGLKEKIFIETNSANPWIWRRIVFTNSTIRIASDSNDYFDPVGVSGMSRALRVVATPTRNILNFELFKGTQTVDWEDHINAQVNTEKCRIFYDRTMSITSGNTAGRILNINRWHGFNKTMIYDDKEIGDVKNINYWAASSVHNTLDDVYVLDMFRPASYSTVANTLVFNPQATIYWHER